PWLSIETLETWPHTHLLGSFGHDGSTSKCGIMRGGWGACAQTAVIWPESAMAATNAMKAERVFAYIGIPRGLALCLTSGIASDALATDGGVSAQRDLQPQR